MTKTSIGCLMAVALAFTACSKKDDAGAAGKASEGKAQSKSDDSTGIPECDALLAAAKKFGACDKLDANAKQMYGDPYIEGLKKNIVTTSDDAKRKSADGCKQAMSELAEGAKFRGCAL